MIDMTSPLITEFVKDHQQFSRLLYQVSKLLDEGKIEQARVRARELDALAGSHIAYEEQELYPRLEQLGVKSVTQAALLHEHADALKALKMLIHSEELDSQQLEEVKRGFRDALDHAEHCGSLISLMTQLDEQEQANSLSVLKKLRITGSTWTKP